MESDTSSVMSSVSSELEDDDEPASMTGKGIKHLCSELLELKVESDEDFHRTISSNYSAFIRIFEEVEGMENELLQLKKHVSTQKRLVNDLIDGIYFEALSEETIDSIIEESVDSEPHLRNKLKVNTYDVSETLDTLLSENRIDEALTILEMEDENFQRIQFEENIPEDVLMFYNSVISERKAMLTSQLTLVAANPRITAPELQKALVGVCRLGDSHLATQLLLKYYHSRIAAGIQNLQCSKSFLHRVSIRELAKFVFSMISQAARSFVMLYGETSPYASELIQWACEETKVFVACFDKYIKSISEISGGLPTAVEAVGFAISFCSLLETQKIVLKPYLMNHIRHSVEEVVQIHIDHFKKVVGILTANDVWVLGRYLVSGILNEGRSSIVVGQQPEYCLLTNSGRKLVTLLQAIMEDVSPLVYLQMGGAIVKGFIDLFTEYVDILERAITCETNIKEKGRSRVNLAETLQQQVSVLANVSTLEYLFTSIIRSIFKGSNTDNFELMSNPGVSFQHKELDNCILNVQETSDRFRAHFCQQFVYRMISVETSCKLTAETCTDDQCDSDERHVVMPSALFQVLFLELRKLEKLAEEDVFEVEWLMELPRELIEATLILVLNNKEIWVATEEKTTEANNFKQIVLDMQFLVELAKHGGYFSNNPMDLVTLINSAFYSSGLDPDRDFNSDEWAINAATEAIQKLLEFEKTKLLPNAESSGIPQEEPHENQSEHTSDAFQDARSSSNDSIESEEIVVAIDTSEVATIVETEILNALSPQRESLNVLEEESSDDRAALNLIDTFVGLEDTECQNKANAVCDELQMIEKTNTPAPVLSMHNVGDTSDLSIPVEDEASSQHGVSHSFTNKPEDDADTALLGTEVASTEDAVRRQCQEKRYDAEISSFVLGKDFEDNQSEVVTLIKPEVIDEREKDGTEGINKIESKKHIDEKEKDSMEGISSTEEKPS